MRHEQTYLTNFHDTLFVISAVYMNIAISIIYVSTKLDLTNIRQGTGFTFITLIIPFTLTFRGYMKKEAEQKIIISNMIILIYLLLELILDYVLKIPFREIPVIHIPYIIILYAAEFSSVQISFHISRKTGYVVTASFCVLIGCLVYLLTG